MQLITVPQLTARQTELKKQVSELQKLKSAVSYLRMNADPSGYQEAEKFTESYTDQLDEFTSKAEGFTQLVEGWRELEAHFGGVEKLRLALVDLATAEADISRALYRNQALNRAKDDPEGELLELAQCLVLNAHPAKSVRLYKRSGEYFVNQKAEAVAYAHGITPEQALARAQLLITDTKLTYNATTQSWKQTVSL
jgi:hypothetical protein